MARKVRTLKEWLKIRRTQIFRLEMHLAAIPPSHIEDDLCEGCLNALSRMSDRAEYIGKALEARSRSQT